ncbi:thioester protein 1 [Anopheles sinensis]|uniref:Thioester protein 1 n=1 Tax=Anopheles sinensis TaxID=74873 RepID=A0A084VHP0_ANOSI|nr:thioester protein 1 [Anopheles sinensis]
MDTIAQLNALTKLVEFINPSKNDYRVTYKFFNRYKKLHANRVWYLSISPRDTRPIMIEDIPKDTRQMQIEVLGKGVGLFSLQYEFGVNLVNHQRRFGLSLEKLKPVSNFELKLKVCVSYISRLDYRSNMAIVEVNFPSGYTVDNDPISMVTGDSSIEVGNVRKKHK